MNPKQKILFICQHNSGRGQRDEIEAWLSNPDDGTFSYHKLKS